MGCETRGFDRTNLVLLLAIAVGVGLTFWKIHHGREHRGPVAAAGCAGSLGTLDPRFVGRWRLVDERGLTGGWLNVTRIGPIRDHAPHVGGSWECSGDELRIDWDDGFRDVLRVEPDGRVALLALGEGGEVRFRLSAERRGR